MSKEYTLKKISDLVLIPNERFDDFLADLKQWHGAMRAANDLIKAAAEIAGEAVPEDTISMRWIDDGKHDGKIIFTSSEEPQTK